MDIDFTQHSDREILMNVVPRLEHAERDIADQRGRQDRLEGTIADLRRDLAATETRLSERQDKRFDSIDTHLNAQDERLDKMVQNVADKKPKWTQGAVITATTLTTIIAFVIVAGVTHLFGW